MTVAAVVTSPSRIVNWIGDAPRCRLARDRARHDVSARHDVRATRRGRWAGEQVSRQARPRTNTYICIHQYIYMYSPPSARTPRTRTLQLCKLRAVPQQQHNSSTTPAGLGGGLWGWIGGWRPSYGRSEGWRFMVPVRNAAITSDGIRCPNETTTPRSKPAEISGSGDHAPPVSWSGNVWSVIPCS